MVFCYNMSFMQAFLHKTITRPAIFTYIYNISVYPCQYIFLCRPLYNTIDWGVIYTTRTLSSQSMPF